LYIYDEGNKEDCCLNIACDMDTLAQVSSKSSITMEKEMMTVVEEESSTIEILKISPTSLGLPSTSSYASIRDTFHAAKRELLLTDVTSERRPLCRNGFFHLYFNIRILMLFPRPSFFFLFFSEYFIARFFAVT